jgi:hypothetical protein
VTSPMSGADGESTFARRHQPLFNWCAWRDLNPQNLVSKTSMFTISSHAQTGVLEEIRTPNPQIRSLALYPVELREQSWMPELDSNQHKLNQNQLSYR